MFYLIPEKGVEEAHGENNNLAYLLVQWLSIEQYEVI